MSNTDDAQWMTQALVLAKQAEREGEVPVGAIIVHEGKLIGSGFNAPISKQDCTAHAEIQAIRQACVGMTNYRLPHSTLYVTLEPCAMCAGAIIHSRIDRVVIATKEPRSGAGGSVFNILNNEKLNHRCQVEFGLQADVSANMLKQFFKARRG